MRERERNRRRKIFVGKVRGKFIVAENDQKKKKRRKKNLKKKKSRNERNGRRISWLAQTG